MRQLEIRVNDLERGGSIGELERKQLLGETTEVKNELKEVTGHVGQISEKVAHIAGRLEGRGNTVNVTTTAQSHGDQNIGEGASGAQGKIGEMKG